MTAPDATADNAYDLPHASPMKDAGRHSSGGTDAKNSPKGHAIEEDLEFILDIPLEVTVELGRTKMIINELLKLGQGSVIELTKTAGETLEILANQKLIARGEVVSINENYGVRITEIISPLERVKRLK